VEVVRGVAGEESVRGEAAAVQCKSEAVAGKGGDDGGLIADGPQVFSDGVTAEEAVRDGADGERTLEEGFGAVEARAEMRGLGEKRGERVPAATGIAEEFTLDDEAEVGGVGFRGPALWSRAKRLFYERETAVAAMEKEELDGVAECGDLGRCEAEVHFEADEVGVRAEERARKTAEVVLAGGEKNVRRGEGEGVAGAGDVDAPEIAAAVEGLGGVFAEDESMGSAGALEKGFIE
jgi:hypothetical protein